MQRTAGRVHIVELATVRWKSHFSRSLPALHTRLVLGVGGWAENAVPVDVPGGVEGYGRLRGAMRAA